MWEAAAPSLDPKDLPDNRASQEHPADQESKETEVTLDNLVLLDLADLPAQWEPRATRERRETLVMLTQ